MENFFVLRMPNSKLYIYDSNGVFLGLILNSSLISPFG